MRLYPNYTIFLLIVILTNSCISERGLLKRYELEPATITIKGDKLFVEGIVGKLFYKEFKKALDENSQLKTIVLKEIPGSINDAWNSKSCQLLHEKGLTTELLENSVVESGGTDLFVSGKQLIIADGAKIGVHAWAGAGKPATSYPRDHPQHKLFLELYPKVNVDTSFYWFTLRAAPADTIHFMTPEEIDTYLGHKTKK